jgi:hypothetical protein
MNSNPIFAKVEGQQGVERMGAVKLRAAFVCRINYPTASCGE